MQEFQSLPGLAGRLFGGAGSSDLRRPHHHHHQQASGPGAARCGGGVSPAGAALPPEAVKCPRCESTNTKFCYYNNYNLSQPRHFCKSCRRYWTKGGVLRNVPVGGGCRKAKRNSASASSAAATSSTPTPGGAEAKNPRRGSASSPRSGSSTNSGSTSPTVTTTTAKTLGTQSSSSSNNMAFTTEGHRSTNPFSSSTADVAPPAPIFADQAAALASLFAPPPPPILPVFSFTAQAQQQQAKDDEEGQVATGDDLAAAFTSLDAAGIFEQLGDDATAAAAYWNAGSCWTDVQDPSVYLP